MEMSEKEFSISEFYVKIITVRAEIIYKTARIWYCEYILLKLR